MAKTSKKSKSREKDTTFSVSWFTLSQTLIILLSLPNALYWIAAYLFYWANGSALLRPTTYLTISFLHIDRMPFIPAALFTLMVAVIAVYYLQWGSDLVKQKQKAALLVLAEFAVLAMVVTFLETSIPYELI